MTKKELEEKILKGESVFSIDPLYPYGVCVNENKFEKEDLVWLNSEHFYKTKVEAEHYLNHANITRTEKLPFLTWEEFNIRYTFSFSSRSGRKFDLWLSNGIISLEPQFSGVYAEWAATEENFYRAYDECVKLFKQD